MESSFDIVIVGAGSAGCVLATRLSRDPNIRVLVLEAGGWDSNPLISIPIGAGKLTQWGLHQWNDVAEPDPGLAGRRLPVIHGRVLGGSSSLNFMAHVHGAPADYDRWAAGGAEGWSYRDLQPHFRAIEAWAGPAGERRGRDGELGVREAPLDDPIFPSWFDMLEAHGVRRVDDYNETPDGVAPIQYTIRGGRRSSAAAAFLKPVLGRPNLTVVTGATATRVLFDKRRAIGVEYVRNGRTKQVRSSQRTVLCLGAINTPHLLMLSGVGPAGHLVEMGIAPIADLPVGRNLQDHLGFALYWTRPQPGAFHRSLRFDRVARNMAQAYLFGSGPGSCLPAVLLGFLRSRPDVARPDLEMLFQMSPPEADFWFPGLRPAYGDGYGIKSYLLSQKSRGSVRLRSADPRVRPAIQFNSLSAPEDLEAMRRAFKIAWAMGASPELAAFRGVPTIEEPRNDSEIDQFIRANAMQQWHPGCTCRMGVGDNTVVDAKLNVHGLDGLSVMDASVMPRLVSGNLNVPIIAMASRAAELWQGA
jgi:choline dehydrogenase-like flavoprotein